MNEQSINRPIKHQTSKLNEPNSLVRSFVPPFLRSFVSSFLTHQTTNPYTIHPHFLTRQEISHGLVKTRRERRAGKGDAGADADAGDGEKEEEEEERRQKKDGDAAGVDRCR